MASTAEGGTAWLEHAVDPVTAPADELGAAPVRLTMTGGHVTHRAVGQG